ncbi:hypothetical protein EV2_020959 [Malus domestica]
MQWMAAPVAQFVIKFKTLLIKMQRTKEKSYLQKLQWPIVTALVIHSFIGFAAQARGEGDRRRQREYCCVENNGQWKRS